MTVDVLLIGSGRMALDIGGYLMGHGRTVAWVSSTPQRLEIVERRAAKILRRIRRSSPQTAQNVSYSVHRLDDGAMPTAECVIETTAESLAKKQRSLDAVAERCENALLLSNSSSLLPSRIHPRCLGLHFFYPVALTALAELILPQSATARAKAERFAAANELKLIIEDEHSAFAANRILVPLQVECMRALRAGVAPEVVDECSVVGTATAGQLHLMETVGFEIVRASIRNYRALPGPIETTDTAVLGEALAQLTACTEQRGADGRGLLAGAPLPWPPVAVDRSAHEALRLRLAAVYANTVLLYEEHGVLDRPALDAIVGQVHGAAESVEGLIESLGAESIRAVLASLYRNDARSYFQPSQLLS